FLADSAVTDEAKLEIAEKVYNEVRRQLSSNPQIKAVVQRAIDEGDLGIQHQGNVVKLIGNRANLLIDQAARAVIPPDTRNVLGIHEEKVAKVAKANSRADVTGGGAPGGKQTIIPEKGDAEFYRKHSDMQIMDL